MDQKEIDYVGKAVQNNNNNNNNNNKENKSPGVISLDIFYYINKLDTLFESKCISFISKCKEAFKRYDTIKVAFALESDAIDFNNLKSIGNTLIGKLYSMNDVIDEELERVGELLDSIEDLKEEEKNKGEEYVNLIAYYNDTISTCVLQSQYIKHHIEIITKLFVNELKDDKSDTGSDSHSSGESDSGDDMWVGYDNVNDD